MFGLGERNVRIIWQCNKVINYIVLYTYYIPIQYIPM